MRRSHEEVFAKWLDYKLEQQRGDLEVYFSGLEPERRTILSTWGRMRPYTTWPPHAARDLEKDLFVADLETLLSLLRNEHGVSSPDPGA